MKYAGFIFLIFSMIIQITAPHFCAGIVLSEDNDLFRNIYNVTKAAPIIKYMIGYSKEQVLAYCIKKRWSTRIID